ncbi:hypothetical protein F2Q70_00039330 [Brassica cretica]|uniref:Uncharacterized protein n=1 Tax=Brassica cretica TaxID=69181 RepID=A0A8S9K400_BRACR|nr:hypothetical protein F2Q70_00039330 [Brassica cretica]
MIMSFDLLIGVLIYYPMVLISTLDHTIRVPSQEIRKVNSLKEERLLLKTITNQLNQTMKGSMDKMMNAKMEEFRLEIRQGCQ